MITNFESLKKICPNIGKNTQNLIEKFGICVSEHYAKLVDWNNPDDPLYRVIVPTYAETQIAPYEVADPIGDNSSEFKTQKTKMLIHRYPDRALLLTTQKCAGRCRYCFRRDKIFDVNDEFSPTEFQKSLKYIHDNKFLREVVLSGGDPLCMPRTKLYEILDFVSQKCPHIRTLRIHTRAIVYNPSIMTKTLSQKLNAFSKHTPLVLMTHIVHPREITPELKSALSVLECVKINQMPLLRGVNNDVSVLCELSYKLLSVGILPHYIHILDKARGTNHFRISIAEAQDLVEKMMGHIGGHLVPKIILDTPAGIGKVWLNKSFVLRDEIIDGKRHLTIKSTHTPNKTFDYVDEG